jgi:hypothetical protein
MANTKSPVGARAEIEREPVHSHRDSWCRPADFEPKRGNREQLQGVGPEPLAPDWEPLQTGSHRTRTTIGSPISARDQGCGGENSSRECVGIAGGGEELPVN